MQPKNLILRCYAESKNGLWQAFCIDLCLAAQGDSFEEVRDKIHSQIFDYLDDVLCGEDREFADQLLNRKAPLSQIAKFHAFHTLGRFNNFTGEFLNSFRRFTEVMPVKLAA
jgi:hypothetical protein